MRALSVKELMHNLLLIRTLAEQMKQPAHAIGLRLETLTYPSIQQCCDNVFAWKPLNCSSFSSCFLHDDHIGFGRHWNCSDFGCSS